jgi:hypothetical protein
MKGQMKELIETLVRFLDRSRANGRGLKGIFRSDQDIESYRRTVMRPE